MENAKTILYRLGAVPSMVSVVHSQSIHRPDIVRELMETAHKHNCGTIVVGRDSYPSYVGEALVQKSQGVAVWVIA